MGVGIRARSLSRSVAPAASPSCACACGDSRGRVRSGAGRRGRGGHVAAAGRGGGGGGEEDDLDWEPSDWEGEARRGRRRRGAGEDGGRSLQLQRTRPSTSYGEGYGGGAYYGRRRSRWADASAPPPGFFSREALQTDAGRRNALLTVILGGAAATVLFSDATTYSQLDSDALTEEVDLLVSMTGVLYARTGGGSFYEFYNDGRGTSLVVAKIGTKNAVFNLDDGGDDESYMELVNRAGRTVLVPKEYVRMLCEASRSIYDKGILRENTGGVDVKPAPPQVSMYRKYAGFLAPNGYRDDADIKLMRFGGTVG